MKLRELKEDKHIALNLLLEADPSEKIVTDYLYKGRCFVVENEDVIGAFVLLPTRSGVIELINISVDEKFQNKGIGKFMISYAVEIAKAEGYKIIEVGTGNSSINQLAFYQKCGFEFKNIEKGFFIHHYDEEIFENGIQCIDMIRFEKRLI